MTVYQACGYEAARISDLYVVLASSFVAMILASRSMTSSIKSKFARSCGGRRPITKAMRWREPAGPR